MGKSNFYADLKTSIEKWFGFLKEYGFSPFEENHLSHETHFKTSNEFVAMDIWFEFIPSTPIWIKMDQYYLRSLEPDNKALAAYNTQLKANYDALFEHYLKTKDIVFLDKIEEQYALNGQQLNDNYIRELSEMLKKHPLVLSGNLAIFKANAQIQEKIYESKIASERIENGIFTLEYQFFSADEFDCFEEFKDVKAIRNYLAERREIKNYRVLDCNMNEVHLEP